LKYAYHNPHIFVSTTIHVGALQLAGLSLA